MSEYREYVTVASNECEGVILAYAPAWSGLKGRDVEIEHPLTKALRTGRVIASATFHVDDEQDEIELLKSTVMRDTTMPLPRVVAVIHRQELTWDEEEEEEDE